MGDEFSEGQGQLNTQRGLDSRGLPCFSANVFCGNIVINYSYHHVYSKMILEIMIPLF